MKFGLYLINIDECISKYDAIDNYSAITYFAKRKNMSNNELLKIFSVKPL